VKARRSAPRYVNKLSNRIRRELDSNPREQQMSSASAKVLGFLLDTDGPIYQRDIEEEFGIRPPSATALLKKLEDEGFIVRKSMEGDGRYKEIVVTDKGLVMKDVVCGRITSLEEKVCKGISEEDLETFLNVIEKMIENMT